MAKALPDVTRGWGTMIFFSGNHYLVSLFCVYSHLENYFLDLGSQGPPCPLIPSILATIRRNQTLVLTVLLITML